MKLTPLQATGLAVPLVLLIAGCIFLATMTPKEQPTNCPVVAAPVKQEEKRMTNDEIIAEVHKCESAGLRSTEYRASDVGAGDRTVHIECGPK